MKNKKEKLQKLLELIEEISNQSDNDWFKQELQRKVINGNNTITYGNTPLLEIKKDTSKIIDFLELNPSCSVDYSFIEHKLLRTRLELDNLRMENVRYDIKEKDEMKRLYDFCINAFYQVENLINYFYYEKYPNINDLLYHLENIEGSKFKRKDEKNIGEINIATKIFAFTRTHYNVSSDKYVGMNMDSLRLIRNEGLHRCTRIKNIETENERLHKFIKHATFDSIQAIVDLLSKKVKSLLNK